MSAFFMIIGIQDDHYIDQLVMLTCVQLINAPSGTRARSRRAAGHYLIRAIPYQDPRQEAERLKAVHEARVKIVPRV
jgi:hypothetical protein